MVECTKYRQINKGSLQGYADIFVEKWGVEIYGISLHMKNDSRWINLPFKEYTNADGEKKYPSVLRFRNVEHFHAFSEAVKKAIDDFCAKNTEDSDFDDSTCPF